MLKKQICKYDRQTERIHTKTEKNTKLNIECQVENISQNLSI